MILLKNMEKGAKEQRYLLEKAHEYLLNPDLPEKLTGNRPLRDLVTLFGWHTDEQGGRELFYSSVSAAECYAWKLNFEPGALCDLHEHSHIELTYVVEGSLKMCIGEEVLTFYQGEFVLINSGVFHGEYLYHEECTLICMGIDDSFFDKYTEPQQQHDYTQSLKKLINEKRSQYFYIRFSPINDSPQTILALATILQEMCDNLPGKKRLIIGYVERIVDLLTKEFQMQVARQDTADFHDALLHDIKNYIRCHYNNVTVSQIGDIFHFSPDYLSRIFRRQTGLTLSAYIQDLRLTEAMGLLSETEDSVEKIAEQVGYHNLGFFNKKFKKKYHKLPGAIRKH